MGILSRIIGCVFSKYACYACSHFKRQSELIACQFCNQLFCSCHGKMFNSRWTCNRCIAQKTPGFTVGSWVREKNTGMIGMVTCDCRSHYLRCCVVKYSTERRLDRNLALGYFDPGTAYQKFEQLEPCNPIILPATVGATPAYAVSHE
jgi:hypothetical protein